MKMKEDKIIQIVSNFVCIICSSVAVIPVILLIIASFTDNAWATANGFSFFPEKFSVEAYKYIAIQGSTIGRAYLMTFLVTVVGVTISLLISVPYGYAISQKNVPGMNVFSFLLVFTMLFNGGIVSTYYCYVRLYGIKDTIWALIIPNLLMNSFEVILLRNYFANSIPTSLVEAARIDRAGEFRILLDVVIPLSKPIIATVLMMRALAYWNDWTNGLYFLSDRSGAHLYTIQNVLNKINENIEVLRQNSSAGAAIGIGALQMPTTTVRMAIAVIGIIPLLISYPFFQQYFVKGITLGGVKE